MNHRSIAREFLASLVVFLIALPMCMGISVACGVPAYKGLLTGVIGGLVVGLIGGCRLQVSGPAAGLTVTVVELIQQHGLAVLGPVIAAAGLLQVLAGFFKLGRVFLAVSPAVVRGMLTGMGIVILVSQLHIVLDHKPHGGTIANVLELPGTIAGLLQAEDPFTHKHTLAAFIGVLTVSCMVLWRLFKLDKRLHIPEALPAIIIGTATATWLGFGIDRVDVPDSLGEMLAVTAPSQYLSLLNGSVLLAVLTVAVIASIETLLSASSVDAISQQTSDYDRELKAQGLGNLLAGFFGALPLNGGIVRSKANMEAGARTRWSTVMHGVWLVIAVVALPWLMEKIPTSSLAALLVVVGWRLIDFKAIRDFRKLGWAELGIFALTVSLIISTNLLIGVGIGLFVSFIRIAWVLMHVEVEVSQCAAAHTVSLRGAATFKCRPRLLQKLDSLPRGTEVHLDFKGLLFIDHACLEVIEKWAERHEAGGGHVIWNRIVLDQKFNCRPGKRRAD